MSTRKKLLCIISSLWILLFIIVFFVSRSILLSSSGDLERKLAIEGNQRVYNTFVVNLNSFFELIDLNANSEGIYDFVTGESDEFIKEEFGRDYFTEEDITAAIIFDKRGKIIWGKGFNIKTKTYTELFPNQIKMFEHFRKMLKGKSQGYHIVDTEYGVAGFIQIDNRLDYIAANYIYPDDDTKGPLAMLVLSRPIDKDFIARLSKQTNYKINILSLDELKAKDPQSYNGLLNSEGVYLNFKSEGLLSSFRLIKSYDDKAIYVMKVDLPREVYLQAQKAASVSLFILIILSLMGTGSMIVVIFLLFNQQEKITNSFERFVPQEFLELLNKDNILDIEVGNNVEKEISVMFTDIRNFTSVSEKMTAKMNFDFVNAYLMKIAPSIAEKNGFIDKYIGDGIMALFHREISSADDAVQAAIHILEQLHSFNSTSRREGWPVISLGVGINTGMLRLGIIGGGARLEGTAISDTVNTSARIESMTKYYGVQMLISESTMKGLNDPNLYHIRFIDEIVMKGKNEPVAVYEVFDADHTTQKEKKEKIKDVYKDAYEHYKNGDYHKALAGFQSCLEIMPDDMASQHFAGKCKQAIDQGITEKPFITIQTQK